MIVFGLLCVLSPSGFSQEGGESEDGKGAKSTDKKIFSGPQAGETLSEVPVWVASKDDQPSHKVDLAEFSKKSPVAIAFLHEKSRPAFGLARLMSAFAQRRKESGLQVVFVRLTEDRSSEEKWLRQIRRYFSGPTQLAVADGGIEGPGSLGLNRLVAMTILIAQDGKVTSNFALTQVSTATDGPLVLAAMNEVSGGGEVPSVTELMPRARRPDRKREK